jgi:hypothetical protein
LPEHAQPVAVREFVHIVGVVAAFAQPFDDTLQA